MVKIQGAPSGPFVVAEVGSNWVTIQDTLASISLAKACGADAVKFQHFSHEELYGLPAPLGPLRAIPTEWLPKLKEKADACGIEFMCSAFSAAGVRRVDPFVRIHKVASSEAMDLVILRAADATGKPVFWSTGALNPGEVLSLLQGFSVTPTVGKTISWPGLSSERWVPLYCRGSYPAHDADPAQMVEMSKALAGAYQVGFSDHSLDVFHSPLEAARLGAVVIEKHVNFLGVQSPDSGHSLSRDDFKRMVDALRGRPSPVAVPIDMITKHRRRLIATRRISKGEAFVAGENFGSFRSLAPETHAFAPWGLELVHGRPAARDIEAGAGIGPGDVD